LRYGRPPDRPVDAIMKGILWSPPMTFGILVMATEYFRRQMGEGRIPLKLTVNPEHRFSGEEEELLSKELNITMGYDREIPVSHIWCPMKEQS